MTLEFPPPRERIQERLKAGERALERAMSANQRILRPRETLVCAGEPHDEIYRLTSGWMTRSRVLPDGRQQIIMVFLPGDLLGLKAMLLDRQPDSIQSITRATVQALNYEAALDLARADPDVSLRFMWQLAEDERRLHNWVIALGRGSAVERIATLMLDLRGRLNHGRPGADTRSMAHGITMVHVNRTLKKLRDVISVGHGLAQIHDLEALATHAAPIQDIFERESASFGGGMPGGSMSS